MACGSSDLARRVLRFKLQLTGATDAAKVLKVLKKLKDLDVTLDVLAETGIGKTVNLLRRHEEAGELAKSLVQDWKNLVSKSSTSYTEERQVQESFPVEETDEQNYPSDESLTMEDVNNNHITSHIKSHCSSNEDHFKAGNRKTEKQCKEREKYENQVKSRGGKHNFPQNNEDSDVFHGLLDGHHHKAKSVSRERTKSEPGKSGSVREINKKSKMSKGGNDSSSHESKAKFSKMSSVMSSSDSKIKKRPKSGEEDHANLKYNSESNTKDRSKRENKKAKRKHDGAGRDSEKPSMSFESCLSYDVNGARAGPKKHCKKIKTAPKDPVTTFKSPTVTQNVTSPKQVKESALGLMNSPAAALPKWENPSSVKYFERKDEKGADVCDVPEESMGFTGQRLNTKMQVYSGTKTIFLPSMMTLHQQCIRTLQNNIDLLYETGGIPLEILEPVLERCTPEQLLRIEDHNPIYIGETDHLWGRHCERDFRDSKLQEYESWKEMYIRLHQERERKFQRLTKSIVMAHSNKPKGRQVKMAFIHSVAKPPRNVRIRQEIHGTAGGQPIPPRHRFQGQDNRLGQHGGEHSRSSSTSSGAGFTNPDGRRRTRIAPMMAKSLRDFKNHLGYK